MENVSAVKYYTWFLAKTSWIADAAEILNTLTLN